MSEPLDLDLVELRCKLRGGTLIHRDAKEIRVIVPERPGYAAAVITTNGDVDVHETGYTAASSLTAPRWTLERLLSEPPEGWKVVLDASEYPGERLLEWGGSLHAPEMSMRVLTEPGVDMDVVRWSRPCTLARLAERHKAAAELALILAEVEP